MSIKVVFVGDFPKQSISKAFAAFEALLSMDEQLEILTLLYKNPTTGNPTSLSQMNVPVCNLYKIPIELHTIDPELDEYATVVDIPKSAMELIQNAGEEYCKEQDVAFNDMLFEYAKELTMLRSLDVTHFIMPKSMKVSGIVTRSEIFKAMIKTIKVIEV